MSDNLVLHFDTHPIRLISVFVCACMYTRAVFTELGFLKVTESEDVADGVQEHCLLQNQLPVFAFEPGCLWFPKLFSEAGGAGVLPRACVAARVWRGERGDAGTATGAELGLCWG